MPCPHGAGPPTSCSQCRGVKPRIVTRNDRSGRLVIDGQEITNRPFALGPEAPRNVKRGRRPAAAGDTLRDDEN